MRQIIEPVEIPQSGSVLATGVAVAAVDGAAVPYGRSTLIEVEAGGAAVDVTIPESLTWRAQPAGAPHGLGVTVPAGERALLRLESMVYGHQGTIHIDLSADATLRAYAL